MEESAAVVAEEGSSVAAEAAEGCLANSFVAGTKVLLASGKHRAIERVGIGDRLAAAHSGVDRRTANRSVSALIHHRDANLYRLRIGNETIRATGHHPFYDAHRGWTEVKDLKAGMPLATANGGRVRLRSIHGLHVGQPIVYNLTVRELHTYFVGEREVLVHNCAVEGGLGNIGGGSTTVDSALSSGQTWLGEGATEVGSNPSQMIYRSVDGLRQFRIDLIQGEAHFESIASNGGTILENSHVPLIGFP